MAENDGHLVKALKDALDEHNISVQRYWCGALVGPDCRQMLAVYPEVLDRIGVAVRLHQGEVFPCRGGVTLACCLPHVLHGCLLVRLQCL